MRIALIHSSFEEQDNLNLKSTPHNPISIAAHVDNVRESLEQYNHQVVLIEATNNLLNDVDVARPLDLIFNLSTGIVAKRMQANMIGMLEMTGLPILGSGLSTHIVGLHKGITKALLKANGIPTSHFQLIKDIDDEIDEDFTFPVIVKPEHEGSGIGVTESSKVESPHELHTIISQKMAEHEQVILVEEYLPGREFTVGVMGNDILEVFPIQETKFTEDGPGMLTSQMKIDNEIMTEIPADISEPLKLQLEILAKQVFRLLRCEDYVRIDFRLDEEERPNIIELNTSPGIIKDYSFFPYLAQAAGYSYPELMNRLVELAVKPKHSIP